MVSLLSVIASRFDMVWLNAAVRQISVTQRDGRAPNIPGARSANTLCIQAPRNAVGRDASAGECRRIDEQEHLTRVVAPESIMEDVEKKANPY